MILHVPVNTDYFLDLVPFGAIYSSYFLLIVGFVDFIQCPQHTELNSILTSTILIEHIFSYTGQASNYVQTLRLVNPSKGARSNGPGRPMRWPWQ